MELLAGVLPWAVGLTLISVGGLRLRGLRPEWPHAVVFVLALVVSAGVMPLDRIEVLGHEAEYLELVDGARQVGQGNTASLPAMQWMLFAFGRMGLGHWGTSAVSMVLGALGCAAWSSALSRLQGRWVGLVGGLTLGLWGNLAAWSSSIYNVVFPFFFVCLALWALSLLIDGEDPLGAGLLAGGAAGLAVSLRLDTLWVAPAGILLLLLNRPKAWRSWAPALLLGAGLGLGSFLFLRSTGELPGSGEWAQSFRMNAALLVYFEPFQRLWVLPAVWIGFGLGLRSKWRLWGPLLLLLLSVHLGMSGFNDYGARHLLPAGLALSAALGRCVTQRLAWIPLGVAGLGLVASLVDTRQRFYASEEAFSERLDPALARWGPQELGDCALITEDTRLAPEGAQLSHFNLWNPEEVSALKAQHGCVLFLMGVQDYRWSSLAVRDRALRVERLYELEPLAVVSNTEDGYVALVLRVEQSRRWPSATLVRTLP